MAACSPPSQQGRSAQRTLCIGIDLGGTKISAGLVDSEGRVLARDRQETRASEGPDAVIKRMLDAAHRLLAAHSLRPSDLQGIGVGAPGPIDLRAGLVLKTPNLPGWDRVPLQRLIAEALGVETSLNNDANAAALGEYLFGAGRGTRNMAYCTASTGIGGGFILDGQLYSGTIGAAAEIGHMTVARGGPRCGCGNVGCLEAVASGTAIARTAREYAVANMAPTIMELAQGDPERISAALVARAAAQGDPVAETIIADALEWLGIGMANLVQLLNPELIVIGGGLTKIGPRLFEAVRRVIDQRAFRLPAQVVQVVPAQLGDDVGVLGAAALVLGSQRGRG